MSTINKGGQVHLFDYRQEITSQGFNQHTHRLFSRGIYEGGSLVKINDTTISINAFMCVFEDVNARVSVRIETTQAVTLESTAFSVAPYIVGRFVWQNAEENYMDFLNVSQVNIEDSDIILGKVIVVGGSIEGFDYAEKSWSYNYYHDILSYNPPFKVIPNEPYDTKVTVLPGGPYTIFGKQVQITIPTLSPDFTFPISPNGRSDLVVIDADSTNIEIIQGQNAPGAPVPVSFSSKFPIAIIRFPPSSIAQVKGSYIEYLHPDNFRSNPVQLDYPTETNSVPESYALRDSNADITANRFHSDVDDGESPLTVISTTRVNNLNVQYLNGNDEAFYRNASNLNDGTVDMARLPLAQSGADHVVYADANKDAKIEGNFYSNNEIISTEKKAIAYALVFG